MHKQPSDDLQADWSARKIVGHLAQPHRTAILIGLILNLFVGLSIAFQNLVPKFLVDDALLRPDLNIDERKRQLFFYAGLYLFVGVILRAFIWHLSLRIFASVREKCLLALRARFFQHINHLCITFHARHNSGELFSYLFGSPLANVQQYYQQLTLMLPSESVALVLTIVFLGSWDILLTCIMVCAICIHFWVQSTAFSKMRAIQRDFQIAESEVSGHVADLLRGHRAVKIHSMEEATKNKFIRQMDVIRHKSYKRDVDSHFQHMKQEGVLYAGYAALCIGGGWRYLQGAVSEGQLTAYLTAFIALQSPLRTFFQVAILRGSSRASLERIAALLTTASTTPTPRMSIKAVPRTGDIEFKEVTFGFGEIPIIEQLNLCIPYGQKVALVGSSGAGKSTVAQLALRLYDPQTGSILVGGVNLQHADGGQLRRLFGVVPQDPYMFNTTLRENLRVADSDAMDEAILDACKQANAAEFIEQLPQGLDTHLGEGGVNLSGGQRQRLAIARALLSQPTFYIFDEATSALDTISEQLIKEAVNRITVGKTTIFIAHRLASVEQCDRIIVMDHGRIIQDGSFGDLATQKGKFRELLTTQSAKY